MTEMQCIKVNIPEWLEKEIIFIQEQKETEKNKEALETFYNTTNIIGILSKLSEKSLPEIEGIVYNEKEVEKFLVEISKKLNVIIYYTIVKSSFLITLIAKETHNVDEIVGQFSEGIEDIYDALLALNDDSSVETEILKMMIESISKSVCLTEQDEKNDENEISERIEKYLDSKGYNDDMKMRIIMKMMKFVDHKTDES
jgi:hypothetical protein